VVGETEFGGLRSIAVLVGLALAAWAPLALLISSFWFGWPRPIAIWLTGAAG
jgi:hypothetical protein